MSRVVHFEIPIDDPDRAGAFYGAVFGWRTARWGEVDYWPLTTGEPPGPGAEGAMVPRSATAAALLVYVAVDDIDAAIAAAGPAGGEVVIGKTAIPAMGWSAQIRDTEGNLIGLFQQEGAVPEQG